MFDDYDFSPLSLMLCCGQLYELTIVFACLSQGCCPLYVDPLTCEIAQANDKNVDGGSYVPELCKTLLMIVILVCSLSD